MILARHDVGVLAELLAEAAHWRDQ
jgi:hypothetical protein